MAGKVASLVLAHRRGWIEAAVLTALYAAFVLVMATGETNGVGYFQQPKGVSLWAPLILGGAVNATIMYQHAFAAIPLLLHRGGFSQYALHMAALLGAYLAGHLVYQLALSRTLEPALQSITMAQWTLENLAGAPFIFIMSAIYKVSRDWAMHAFERQSLIQRTTALEDQLHLMRQEVTELKKGMGANHLLRFQSSREHVQTPVSAIIHIKAAGNYVEIITRDKVFTVYSAIRDILEQLPKDQFVRIHRSHIVNLEKVDVIDGAVIHIGETSLPIGGAFKENLLKQWRDTD
jgi:hypothetical protein